MKKSENNKFITQKSLEKTLDTALAKQAKVILKAVDFSIGGLKKDVGGLKENVNKLDKRVSRLETKFDKLETKVDKIEEKTDKIDQILDQQDGIIKQLSDLGEENKMSTSLYKKHDEKIEGHEQRISDLELKIQPAVK